MYTFLTLMKPITIIIMDQITFEANVLSSRVLISHSLMKITAGVSKFK